MNRALTKKINLEELIKLAEQDLLKKKKII